MSDAGGTDASRIHAKAAATTELAQRRTGMAFQRTRMSAERTLMSIIRTSLSLISFGFTIFQFFHRMKEANILQSGSASPRHFGLSLVTLGVVMLFVGIAYHVAFMWQLRGLRHELAAANIIYGRSQFPVSLTLLVAVALLGIGLLAAVSMVFRTGPFG